MARTDNISAYWKMDESSGDAADSVGSATLTNVGTTTYTTGKINNGADGSSNNTGKYFKVANNFSINGGAITMNVWVNLTTAPATNAAMGIIGQSHSTNKVTNRIYYRDSSGTKKLYFNRLIQGITNNGPDVTYTLTTGTWYMITYTYDATTVRGYVNGVEVGNAGGGSGNGSDGNYYDGVVTMALNSTSFGAYWSGLTDEVGIWSRALTAEEVRTLYNANKGLQYNFTSTPTLLYLQNTGDAVDRTTYTYSAQNLGAASSTRTIICAASGRTADGTSSGSVVTSITIGGVTATLANQVQSSGNVQCIGIAAVPTGTTGDVVVVYNETMGNSDIALYAATGISTTATDSGTSTANPLTYALDIAANGIAVATASTDNGTATATWAGLYETYDDATTGGNDKSGAFGLFETAQTNLTVSCTWTSSTRPVYCVASFPMIAAGPANLKTLDGIPLASIKTIDDVAIASVKTYNSIA